MKRVVKIFIGCLLIVNLMSCGRVDKENQTFEGSEAFTYAQDVTEQIPKEEHPVMSEESIDNISAVFDGEKKDEYATQIATYLYLSGLSVSDIMKAEMLESADSEEKLIKVTDSENRSYAVVLTKKFGLIGIKENSQEGDWVFTVTY